MQLVGFHCEVREQADKVRVHADATNPFKGRQYPGDITLQAVRWYLGYPLAYEYVSELLAKRGLEVGASCVWRWVPSLLVRIEQAFPTPPQAHQQELPCRRETYIKVKGQEKYLYRAVNSTGADHHFPAGREARHRRR
jgi:transposase-like protein